WRVVQDVLYIWVAEVVGEHVEFEQVLRLAPDVVVQGRSRDPELGGHVVERGVVVAAGIEGARRGMDQGATLEFVLLVRSLDGIGPRRDALAALAGLARGSGSPPA